MNAKRIVMRQALCEAIQPPTWHGDNAKLVVEVLLPAIKPRLAVAQVIRWAYGYDGTLGSYEKFSNGSSIVPDVFLSGRLKEPQGVGHDWLYNLIRNNEGDPTGFKWTQRPADRWYRWAMRDFGYPLRAWWRWLGLRLFGWVTLL